MSSAKNLLLGCAPSRLFELRVYSFADGEFHSLVRMVGTEDAGWGAPSTLCSAVSMAGREDIIHNLSACENPKLPRFPYDCFLSVVIWFAGLN